MVAWGVVVVAMFVLVEVPAARAACDAKEWFESARQNDQRVAARCLRGSLHSRHTHNDVFKDRRANFIN